MDKQAGQLSQVPKGTKRSAPEESLPSYATKIVDDLTELDNDPSPPIQTTPFEEKVRLLPNF